MGQTSIEWCDHSINPIRARLKATGAVGHYCEKIAAGCMHCYSSTLQRRFQMPEFGGGQKRDDVELFLDESKLAEVRNRKKPTRYFWCDMTDMFGDWVKPEWIDAFFATMDATPQHVHMLLTKRPWNIRKMWPVAGTGKDPGSADYLLRDNVWIGVSASEQASFDVVYPHLVTCRDLSPVLFVSAEPLLGPIKIPVSTTLTERNKAIITMPMLDLVIVGGESGRHARPMHPDWARGLRDQCQSAETAFFFKQWGRFKPCEQSIRSVDGPIVSRTFYSDGCKAPTNVPLNQMPGCFSMWDCGKNKKRAGRVLDGRTWDEMPNESGAQP